MKKLSSKQLKKLTTILSRKFKKEPIVYYKKEGSFMNLYNKNHKYITAVGAEMIKEYVTPIDNRKDNYTGRPRYREYVIKKTPTRLVFNPVGVPWWYHMPYSGPADFQRFLTAADAKGDAVALASQLARGKTVVIKVPMNREPYFKDILRKGSAANPFKKDTRENVEYIKESHRLKWAI